MYNSKNVHKSVDNWRTVEKNVHKSHHWAIARPPMQAYKWRKKGRIVPMRSIAGRVRMVQFLL